MLLFGLFLFLWIGADLSECSVILMGNCILGFEHFFFILSILAERMFCWITFEDLPGVLE